MVPRRKAVLRAFGIAAGLVLCWIGIRFLLVPHAAGRFFGLDAAVPSLGLYYAVGLRDLWLGLMAAGLALWSEWRALALWFGLGALVCFGDGAIAATASGRALPIAFHAASGVLCAALAVACWRQTGRG